MNAKKFLIYGAGGFAREVAWLVESCATPTSPNIVMGFINDDTANQGTIFNDITVFSLETACDRFPDAAVLIGIGSPEVRQKIVEKVTASGLRFGTLVHPRVEMSRWVEIDEGTIICAGNVLTTNITLGKHVHINLDCTIGHDVVVGDYTTLAPGVHISGCVHIGKRVYVGTGAVIINGTLEHPLLIEDDVTIGAGACVTKSISTGLTVVGVPAKPLQKV